MAHGGAAQTDTPASLADEADDIVANAKALRNASRSLLQRAAALRDRLEEAGIGFEETSTKAREGEGD